MPRRSGGRIPVVPIFAALLALLSACQGREEPAFLPEEFGGPGTARSAGGAAGDRKTGNLTEAGLAEAEGGAFVGLESGQWSSDSAPATGRERTLSGGYERRAYPGAPPVIPHAVDPAWEKTGGKSCLACHGSGGYAPTFGAYAPVTPHPQYANCRQCHVPQAGATEFRRSDWSKPTPPVLEQRAQPLGPPRIPHTLQLRGNCAACHVGPSAPVEIRTTHPTRGNCRQCHVPQATEELFQAEASR